MRAANIAKVISAPGQPWAAISAWPTGAMTNWPKEPPALAMPSAMLRRSGATIRPTAPRTTAKPVAAVPNPTNRPAPR